MSNHITVITTRNGQDDTHVTPAAVQILEAAGWKAPSKTTKGFEVFNPSRARLNYGPCSVDGCDTPAKTRGMCHKHYQRVLKHGTTRNTREKFPDVVKHAEQAVAARLSTNEAASQYGYNNFHQMGNALKRRGREDLYAAIKANGTTRIQAGPAACKIDGCDAEHYAKGYCGRHYQRLQRRGGDPTTTQTGGWVAHIGCTVEGCTGPHKAKGLCPKHYMQKRKFGAANAEPVSGRIDRGARSTGTDPDLEIQQAASWAAKYAADRRRRGINPNGTPLEGAPR